MTERIYYTEQTRGAFDATVVAAQEKDGHPAVILDRTAFYPTSGGQPFDVGQLGGARVIDCVDEGDAVVHVLSAPLAVGTNVRGEIDWSRRFDHMQQHTGQHVLSAAFDRLFDNRTMSFHMGAETSTIDLAKEASSVEIAKAIDEANQIIWEDREVRLRFVSSEEAARLSLRKEPVREGTLRLVEIDDFDLSACGGTHVSRTGQIGIVVVAGTDRVRGGSRLTFACGRRVQLLFGDLRDAVSGSIRLLSVLPGELPRAVEKLQSDAKDLRKVIGRLQGQLAADQADRLAQDAPEVGGVRLTVCVVEGWDAGGLKAIASALITKPAVAAVLLSADTPAAVVVARSQGVAVDSSKVLRMLLERFGGRGGGRPDLAQGAGLTGTTTEMMAVARDLLSDARST